MTTGVTTLIPDPRVLRAWRSGPRWFHVVVALITDQDVVRRRQLFADKLADWIQPSAPDQPHVTVWTSGFDAEPVMPDLHMIDIRVGGPATFRSAAYLQVSGPGIARVRQQLAVTNTPEVREGAYIPHLTVGTFSREVPLSHVRRRLRELPEQEQLTVEAHLSHMVVDTRSEVGALLPADPTTSGRSR